MARTSGRPPNVRLEPHACAVLALFSAAWLSRKTRHTRKPAGTHAETLVQRLSLHPSQWRCQDEQRAATGLPHSSRRQFSAATLHGGGPDCRHPPPPLLLPEPAMRLPGQHDRHHWVILSQASGGVPADGVPGCRLAACGCDGEAGRRCSGAVQLSAIALPARRPM